MIVFGTCIPDPEPYLAYAKPGIERAAEPDSAVVAVSTVGTLGRNYNVLLDTAAGYDDLEALVIVHPFTELDDPGFCAKVRDAFSDEQVAVLGFAGATDVRSIAWWEGRASIADVILSYIEHGGGQMPAYPWIDAEPAPGVVDTIDGALIVLSAWAVRELRFDESLRFPYGQDFDFCLQARGAGRRVLTIDTRVILHRALELVEDWDLWLLAHAELAEKWEGRPLWPEAGAAGDADTQRRRARRAEAQAEAARSVGYSRRLAMDARVAELKRSVDEAAGSLSWRATRPLREINRLRRMQRERREPQRKPPIL